MSDLGGTPLAERASDLDIAAGPEAALGWVADRFDELLAEVGRAPDDVYGIGSAYRPVEFESGRPVTRRSCPAGTASRSRMVREPLPGAGLVDNDVNIMALGERRTPGERPSICCYQGGHGIGCGISRTGTSTAERSGAAGDIGHVRATDRTDVVCRCGNIGCLEAIAGGRALAERLAAQARAPPAAATSSASCAAANPRRDQDGPRRRAHARRGPGGDWSTSSTPQYRHRRGHRRSAPSISWPACARESSAARSRWRRATSASSRAGSATAQA